MYFVESAHELHATPIQDPDLDADTNGQRRGSSSRGSPAFGWLELFSLLAANYGARWAGPLLGTGIEVGEHPNGEAEDLMPWEAVAARVGISPITARRYLTQRVHRRACRR